MSTLRVKPDTYKELNVLAGMLQAQLKKPVSMDDVLNYLLKKRLKPSDFAGSWNMSDEEEAEVLRSLREWWSRWKFPSE